MYLTLLILATLSLSGPTRGLVPVAASASRCSAGFEAQDERDAKPVPSATKAARQKRKLHVLLRDGKLDRARELLAGGVSPNGHFKKEGGRSLLHMAVEGAGLREMELLLAFGADVNAVTATGWTSLHLAISDPNRSVVELLLKHGASLEPNDEFGATVLHYAAQFGEARILSLLLTHVSHELAARRDLRGWTALDRAAIFGRDECVRILRKHLNKRLPLGAPDIDSDQGPLLALLTSADTASDVERQEPLDITPFLSSKKSVARTRPIFWITRSSHNGMPSDRNIVHLICAVWADGWYMIRPKYFAPENATVLPALEVGFLPAKTLSTFIAAAEETNYFSRFLPLPSTGPCSAAISVSLLDEGKRLSGSDYRPAASSQADFRGLAGRVRQDAWHLLARLMSRVLDARTQPVGELAGQSLIRGYDPIRPTRTRWWY